MIMIKNVRPVKERKKWRVIHVENLERALDIEKLLAGFNAAIDTNINGEFIVDCKNRYMVHQIQATDAEFNTWIDKLGLIEVGSRRYTRNYTLKEEES